jgi:hypothetical protein
MIAWIFLAWFCLAVFGGLMLGALFHAGKDHRTIFIREDARQKERAA